MAKEKKKKKTADPAEAAARYVTTEVDKAKARKWFVRAQELTDNKNWDYAVQCYVDGLGFWPEAVDEGHQPLRLAASERKIRGGKKPSFTETMKFTMTGKDAKKAMLTQNVNKLIVGGQPTSLSVFSYPFFGYRFPSKWSGSENPPKN